MSTRDLARIIIPILIVIIIASIVVVAVYFPPNGTMVCTYASAPGDPHAEFTYTAHFKLWKVLDTTSEVIVQSKNKKILEDLKMVAEEDQANLNKVDHYKTTISMKGDKLRKVTKIDYQKMTSKQLAALEGNTNPKKVTISSFKKRYKEIGATCSYE